MRGRDAHLALAYAASDAYQQETANLAVIDDALEQLHGRVEIDEPEYVVLRERFRLVLASNRTAPAVMRIMALANEVRISRDEADAAHHRRERRAWATNADRAHKDLLGAIATTLDALIAESW
jgi:hypothetical protein